MTENDRGRTKIKRERTSDAGSQYRCRRVGRGDQSPSTLNAPPNTLSNADTNQFGHVVREFASFCLLFLAVNHSKAGNKLGLGVGLVLGLGIRSGIVLGIGLGLGLGLVLGLGVF